MPVRINGSTSGYIEIDAPAVAGTRTLVLPTDSIQPGLVLVASNTFSAATSLSINNCFTSTYDNYRVMLTVTAASGVVAVNLRLRVSGTDSSTTYTTQQLQVTGTSVAGGRTGAGNTGTEWQVANTSASLPVGINGDIFGPQRAAATSINFTSNFPSGSATIEMYSGSHSTATSYDGLSILAAAGGNITGFIRVYGYRNS
jgi:hypothetical protein